MQQDGERIFLPRNVSLLKLQSLSRLLCTATESSPITDDVNKSSTAQKTFFDRIVGHFRDVLYYEDPNLQKKAKRVVPVVQLEIVTMMKMRDLQK